MANWYAGAVIYRPKESRVEYLVIDTRSLHPGFRGRSKKQTKFVGGTEEGHLSEDVNVLGTLRRELTEETDLCLPEGYHPRLILTVPLPEHFKNFYLIPFGDLVGDLRTVEKVIDNDWMSAPYWMSYEELTRWLYKSHHGALVEANDRFESTAV